MKKFFKSLVWTIFILFFSLLIIASLYFKDQKFEQSPKRMIFSELIKSIDEKKIGNIQFNENYVIARDKKNRLYKVLLDNTSKTLLSEKLMTNLNVNVEHFEIPFWKNFLAQNFLSMLLLLLLGFSFFFAKIPGITTSRNKFKVNLDKKYSFNDIAGLDDCKTEIQDIIDFVRKPEKFTKLGARIPKGILLSGPPGTGKTLLAKAVACEAKCNFFYASGSEFEELYVGLGASRMRALFEEAKKNSPSIIFIDEIDTIGARRNKIHSNVGDQTLNELLTQLDGFNSNSGTVLFAATNRAEILDQALLRPGRLGDKILHLQLPFLAHRQEILEVHLKNIAISPSFNEIFLKRKNSREKNNDKSTIDTSNFEKHIEEKSSDKIISDELCQLAKITVGFSGADLANLVNEAALLAVQENSQFVTIDHLKLSIEKVRMGPENKSIIMTEKEKLNTAYHEAGHAIISKIFDKVNTIHMITILPRGRALGYVRTIPEDDKDPISHTKSSILNNIKVCFGGYVAEQIKFGDDEVTSGPRNDLQQATDLARKMVAYLGMSKLGFMDYDENSNKISQTSLYAIEQKINEILDEAFTQVKKLLKRNESVLDKLAHELIEKETMDSKDISDFFENNPPK